MDNEKQETNVDIMNAWVNKLDERCIVPKTLPPSSSFRRCQFVNLSFLLLTIAHYAPLMYLKHSYRYSSIWGGNLYAFNVILGKTIYSGAVALALLAIGVHYIVLKRMQVIHEIISSEFLTRKSPSLNGDTQKKFLRGMKFLFHVIDISCKYSTVFATVFMLYTTTASILKGNDWKLTPVWYLWALSQVLFANGPMCNVIWVVGFWFALKTHINMQIGQLSEQATRMLTLNSADLRMNFVSLFKTYKILIIKIKKFNHFSKELSFLVTAFNTVFAACLLYSVFLMIDSESLIAFILAFYWVIFEFGSLGVLAASSSIYKENRSLYRTLNEVYVNKSPALSTEMKCELQAMIKNTGSKSKCPLALVNIDGKIYDHQILARYVIYSIRMVAVIARLVSHL